MEVGEKLTIPVQGLGHIPSFKNRKRVTKSGMLITEPKIKKRMERIIRAIESRISFLYQTVVRETRMDKSQRCWIASSVPLDDSGEWIPEGGGYTITRVPKGEEGVVITIERIS